MLTQLHFSKCISNKIIVLAVIPFFFNCKKVLSQNFIEIAGTTTSGFSTQNFTTSPACGVPSNITVTTTSNSATISWSPAFSATAYEIYYRPQCCFSWSNILNITNTSHTITGISGDYFFFVRSVCGAGVFSTNSATLAFSTSAQFRLKTLRSAPSLLPLLK